MLDVDDTTLTTWNYELYSNWDFNPGTNASFVRPDRQHVHREHVPGHARNGRPGQPRQELGTPCSGSPGGAIRSTPQLDTPEFCGSFIDAAVSCPTIQYKSGTRAYIESQGYDIVADFGDQFSDLPGGHADKTFKMPNPNYYLP